MNTIQLFPSKPGQTHKVRAIVLGINEIASAVAVYLTHLRIRVVMSNDPLPPVIRRGMSFHDSLYGELTSINGIWAINRDHTLEILDELSCGNRVIVTRLGLSHLLPIGGFDLIVDARMHKTEVMPILRHLAPVTIGLGPGFVAQETCDVAIETHPDFIGQILTNGAAMSADGIPSLLGDLKHERFIYTTIPGRWTTPLEIGSRVFLGVVLGKLGGQDIIAHRDGILRGIARDGTEMPANVKLVEIDPRGRNAQWQGIDPRAKAIAESTVQAYMQAVQAITHQS